MSKRPESSFAELPVDRLILDAFANEHSAYHMPAEPNDKGTKLVRFRNRLRWHINNSLSQRQKEVIKAYLSGSREREIAHALGVTQQVVNIYKHRAIRKLHKLLAS